MNAGPRGGAPIRRTDFAADAPQHAPLQQHRVQDPISGRVPPDALNNGVSRPPTLAGQFPQVSGLT